RAVHSPKIAAFATRSPVQRTTPVITDFYLSGCEYQYYGGKDYFQYYMTWETASPPYGYGWEMRDTFSSTDDPGGYLSTYQASGGADEDTGLTEDWFYQQGAPYSAEFWFWIRFWDFQSDSTDWYPLDINPIETVDTWTLCGYSPFASVASVTAVGPFSFRSGLVGRDLSFTHLLRSASPASV